jgi:non-ribosomal peptide synthetase component F
MADLDLDLQTAEGELDEPEEGGRVVLGVLDGSTDDEDWIDHVENDDVLVLNVEGDLNELAAGFARDVRDMGGELMHFREFLVISPPGREIDTDRLS